MKPGLYYDMPEKEYRAIPAISQSTLRDFDECARKWKLAPVKVATPAMRHGSLVDELWLRRSMLSIATHAPEAKPVHGYIVQPGGYQAEVKKGKERPEWIAKPWNNSAAFCSSWVEDWEGKGLTVVSATEYLKAAAAAKRLDSVPEFVELHKRCKKQVAMVWKFEGQLCKGLVDMLDADGDAMGDLKCSEYGGEDNWAKTIYNQGLHIQAGFYLDGYEAITGRRLARWFHVVSEPVEPYEPAGPIMDEDFINMGRSEWRRIFRRFVECREKNEWPGYPLNVVVRPLPWMLKAS